jgi:hypothetical protein
MEHYTALIFGQLTECHLGAPHSMRSRSFQIRQLDTLIIRNIDVVVQVEIESRHGMPKVSKAALVPFPDVCEP